MEISTSGDNVHRKTPSEISDGVFCVLDLLCFDGENHVLVGALFHNQYGDANHDGKINVTDAVMVMKHRANALTEEDVFCERCANVDTNPKINVSDAVLIMKKRANKDMIFPIEAQ